MTFHEDLITARQEFNEAVLADGPSGKEHGQSLAHLMRSVEALLAATEKIAERVITSGDILRAATKREEDSYATHYTRYATAFQSMFDAMSEEGKAALRARYGEAQQVDSWPGDTADVSPVVTQHGEPQPEATPPIEGNGVREALHNAVLAPERCPRTGLVREPGESQPDWDARKARKEREMLEARRRDEAAESAIRKARRALGAE